MNRIHKRTMTEEERELNRKKCSELHDQLCELDCDNAEDQVRIDRIRRELSDLGDSAASSELASSEQDPLLAEEYLNRTICQRRIEYERENRKNESVASDLFDDLKNANRREEAVRWLVRAMRHGRFVIADGDKKLLRALLKKPFDEELQRQVLQRSMGYMIRRMNHTLDDFYEIIRKSKVERPDILLCGPSESDCRYLIDCITRPGAEPEGCDLVAEEDRGTSIVCKTTLWPFATVLEPKTIFGPEPELKLPRGRTMKEFVKDVELERHGIPLDDPSEEIPWSERIDAVWYVTNGDRDLLDARERAFIRSAMELPNAMLVANLSCTVVSRESLVAAVDRLTGIIDPDRIVLVDSGYYGLEIDARWRLIEMTKRKQLESEIFQSDEERQAFDSSWTECFGKLLETWHSRSEKNVERCIRHAAGRARFIADQDDGGGLADLLKKGQTLLKDLAGLARGARGDEPELRKDVSHTSELLDNITIMIYELGGCCGHLALRSDVPAILGACKASDLPDDAAAITYAVGMTARAYFESGKTMSLQELKDVFAKAMTEGLGLSFEPMHENDPATLFLFDDLDDDSDDEADDSDDEASDDEADDSDDTDADDSDDEADDEADDSDDIDLDDIILDLDDLDPKDIDDTIEGFDDLLDEIKALNDELGGLIGDDSDGGGFEEEEVDYGSGEVVSSSGSGPDSPDNASARDYRLPDDYPAPARILKSAPFSGGWGYTIQDATVVEADGISAENWFIERRIVEELERKEKNGGGKYVFSDYQKCAHQLVRDGGDSYDLLFVQATIFSEADWNLLKEDWESHNEYENDRKGRRKHEKLRESKSIRFTEHFWFNINSMMSFDDDEKNE